jgi:hypothetical protein
MPCVSGTKCNPPAKQEVIVEQIYKFTCSFCKHVSEFPAKNLSEAINKFLQSHFMHNQMDALRLGMGTYCRTACNYGYFDPMVMFIDLKRDNTYLRVQSATLIKLQEMFSAEFKTA